MNPVSGEAVADDSDVHDASLEMTPAVSETAAEQVAHPETFETHAPTAESVSFANEHQDEYVEPTHFDDAPSMPVIEVAAAGSYYDAPATDAFSAPAETQVTHFESFVADDVAPPFRLPKIDKETAPPFRLPEVEDEDFGVTVINERNSPLKNGLLLMAAVLMVGFMISTVVVNIFGKDFDIASLSDDSVFTLIPEVDPMSIEPEKKPEPEKKDDSGGGGGGGNKNPDPASKGTPPNMMKNPDVAPSTDMTRLQNPTLTQRVGVNGPERVQADTSQPYGVPNGADKLSDGPGSGTGIGTGRGGGVGSGNDSGLGTGSGGGAGNGHNGGIGDGDGNGGPPPPVAKGVTTAYKIIAKPRAAYTDEARTNNVQGSVTLKIVLLASGQVGSITPLNRLPYGLTEQAIAAAKQIKFEPKKVNGVPQATTVTFQYGFNIY